MSEMGQERRFCQTFASLAKPPITTEKADIDCDKGYACTPSVTEECAMHENKNSVSLNTKRSPWNKGKLIGPRPPLRQKHVWAIRTRLQIEQQLRDPALFNLAIDSKLRGCDVVAIRVDELPQMGTPSRGGYCAPKEDRPTGALRAYRTDPTGN